jgi:phage replication-related protein YjqB (UPF0714/DUF867 family)
MAIEYRKCVRVLPVALLVGFASPGLRSSPADGGAGQVVATKDLADPSFPATVRRALESQEDLIDQPEHCSADRAQLGMIGRDLGQQVRIYRDKTSFALFTVSEVCDEVPNSIVRMGRDGRDRLGEVGEFAASVHATAPRPGLGDADAEALGEFVERLDDDGKHRGLIAIAPHGGRIEPHTDQQAERVKEALAGKPVSSWRCKGWSNVEEISASKRWHITSTDIHEASFPLLGRVVGRRFAHAVSFHGFQRADILADVVIGGAGSPCLKEELRAEIAGSLDPELRVVIAGDKDPLNGNDPRNIVNRLAEGSGIQIEQSPRARQLWRPIADAVARVYRSKL